MVARLHQRLKFWGSTGSDLTSFFLAFEANSETKIVKITHSGRGEKGHKYNRKKRKGKRETSVQNENICYIFFFGDIIKS